MKYNKYIVVAIIVILIVLSACSMGCEKEEEDIGISSGFYTFICNPTSVRDYAAYKSNISIFPIEEVVLTFSYGWENVLRREFDEDRDIRSFKIYLFNNDDADNKILIKDISEYTSNAYSCYIETRDSNGEILRLNDGVPYGIYVFNHSEEITIPKELFTGDNGCIVFYGEGRNYSCVDVSDSLTYSPHFNKAFFYKIENGQARLYSLGTEIGYDTPLNIPIKVQNNKRYY